MKKFIAAFDGLKYNAATTRFALQLSKASQAHLVGIFPNDLTYTSYKIHELVLKEGVTPETLRRFEAKDAATRLESIRLFEKACQDAGVHYNVHHDRQFALRQLRHESIYADLLITGIRENFSHYPEKPPTHFVRELLAEAQCPVLLVPDKFRAIEKLVLLYDGEPSSVYAIRQFCYVLSPLNELPAEVVTIKPENATLHLPDNRLMKEFMKRHFSSAAYLVKKGAVNEEILQRLKEQPPGTLVVLGAYRRSAVSRWFRESMADVLMKELKMPLFIAHHK